MGVYYTYINDTKREFVQLSKLQDAGDKDNAVLLCGGALAYLLFPPRHVLRFAVAPNDPPPARGRWHGDAIRVAPDGAGDDPYDLVHFGKAITVTKTDAVGYPYTETVEYVKYQDISKMVLSSLQADYPWFVKDWRPPR